MILFFQEQTSKIDTKIENGSAKKDASPLLQSDQVESDVISRLKDPIYDKVKGGSGNTESSGNSTKSDGIYSSVKNVPKEETAYLVVNLSAPNENYEIVDDKIVRKSTEPSEPSDDIIKSEDSKSFYETVDSDTVKCEEIATIQDSSNSILYEKVASDCVEATSGIDDICMPSDSSLYTKVLKQTSDEPDDSTYDTANHTEIIQPFVTEIESSGPYATVGNDGSSKKHGLENTTDLNIALDPGRSPGLSNEIDPTSTPSDVYESVQEKLPPVIENKVVNKAVEIDRKKHGKHSKKEKQAKHSHGITHIFNIKKNRKASKETDEDLSESDSSSLPGHGKSDSSPSMDIQRKATRTSSSGTTFEEPPPPPSIDRLKNIADHDHRKHGRKPSGDVFNLHTDGKQQFLS